MKLFLDTAEISEIQQAAATGLIDGITTNPTLIAKSGRKFSEVIKEITQLVQGPISAEVISTETSAMLEEGRQLAALHNNIVVKLPMTAAAMPVVKQFAAENRATNVTLVFSVNQALLAAKAGATYVSPFVGRLDDVGEHGMNLVHDIIQVYERYGFTTQVLAASIRHPQHVAQAAEAGAHVATIPFEVFKKLFNHPLTDVGLAQFLSDWKSVPKE